MAGVLRIAEYRARRRAVFFNRNELNQLLAIYSRRVARGEWRDYAIDHRTGAATFSIFERSSTRPLYALVKFVPGTRSRGDYLLLGAGKRVVEGSSLPEVLSAIRGPALLLVSNRSHRA